ncbi:MAG: glutamyl-tRNA reductase [Thermoanaerobaculia bacterium]|nr:glutamyl-tRNA reductase [Thermoanaerobaculia bacterium]
MSPSRTLPEEPAIRSGSEVTESSGPSLLTLGVDFRTAPLELRERVAMTPSEAEELQLRLMASDEIAEALVLSTCNRTEVYLRPEDDETAFRLALELTFGRRAPEIVEQGRHFVLHDREAARRLLTVAAGLESMVLGEPEILGQVKQAGDVAASLGSTGPILRQLVRTALHTGRRARKETEIGVGAISLGYAVVELGRHIFNRLEDRRALIIGAGETGGLAATALSERGVRELSFANRGDARAETFLQRFPQARRIPFEERYEHLAVNDLLVVATAAEEPLFERSDLERVVQQRKSRPLLIVDLGVPRNVDSEAGELENLFLHDIDSLRGLIERNLDRRRAEVAQVEAIVGNELRRFLDWYRGLEAEPLVAQLQRRAEKIRRREVENVAKSFPPELHDDLHRLTRSLVRRLLHHPSHQLRRGDEETGREHLDLVRRLFQLDEDSES